MLHGRLAAITCFLGCLLLVQGCGPSARVRNRQDEVFATKMMQARRLVIYGKRDKGAAMVKDAVNVDPTRFEYYDAATALLSSYGMRKESIALLEQGVRRIHEPSGPFVKSSDNLNKSVLYTRLGYEYWHGGSPEKGEKAYNMAIHLDKNNAWACNDLGYMYAEHGMKLQRALMLTLRAMDLKPNDGMIIDSVGWVYFKMGDKQRALEYLEQAVQLVSDDPELRIHLGAGTRRRPWSSTRKP